MLLAQVSRWDAGRVQTGTACHTTTPLLFLSLFDPVRLCVRSVCVVLLVRCGVGGVLWRDSRDPVKPHRATHTPHTTHTHSTVSHHTTFVTLHTSLLSLSLSPSSLLPTQLSLSP